MHCGDNSAGRTPGDAGEVRVRRVVGCPFQGDQGKDGDDVTTIARERSFTPLLAKAIAPMPRHWSGYGDSVGTLPATAIADTAARGRAGNVTDRAVR